jgi:alpha-L-fucosidase
MDESWGEQVAKLRADNSKRGELFNDGNYAMFIHWGLYSQIANQYKGETYYGIGEWIMHNRMADIPVDEYKTIAKEFNPVKFDADAVVKLAKDAGMKYVVITSKHHDGFAMYDSDVNDFNVVDATPFGRDPMKDLAAACKKQGLGLGFYYSHNKDWTFPGARGGPETTEEGVPADFNYYFENKCRPQVEEITSKYGPIELVWFDTPGGMEKKYVEELVAITRKNQPHALVSGRAGHGLGDYVTHGDMEVPNGNVEGMWETVDTTNDSWAYAWYDRNWKTPKEILKRLISTVARGGTYMLNIGPRGDGSVPIEAQMALRTSGAWIQRYPFVVYGTDASPWGHALPWGDVTVKENKLFLSIFDLPGDRMLNLPGLKSEIKSVTLINADEKKPLLFKKEQGWTRIELPCEMQEKLVPVLEITLAGSPDVDPCWGLDPEVPTELLVEFADVSGAEKSKKRWMEKFGEWKHAYQASKWEKGGTASWEVDVLEPGYYQVDLTYSGEGRIVWSVGVENGDRIQNQQNSSHNYQAFPIGWLHFPEAGRHRVSVSCLEGDLEQASLKAIQFKRIDLDP